MEHNFLQTQINDLSTKCAALEHNVMQAIAVANKNEVSMKALHQRMDKVATREDFQKMLEAQRNKDTAELAKKIAYTVITLGLGSLFAWVTGVFKSL